MFSNFKRLILALMLLSLSACGFAPRGTANLAFHSLYMQGSKLTINKDLIKALKVNGIEIVTDAEKAEMFLETLSESSTQVILSLSGDGRVREYQLVYKASYRIRDAANPLWNAVQTIEGKRDFSYDDTQLLAKQFEEARLLDDMKTDAVRSIMRSLVLHKPHKN